MTGTGTTVLPLIERWSGLDLERGGQGAAICRFVAGRALALGLPSPQAYVERLGEAGGEEEQRLVHAITICHTWFFRDPQQLEQIAALWRARYPAGQRVSVWVAGCASGEDVYSLALLGERESRPLSLLGSDINGGALAVDAKIGVDDALHLLRFHLRRPEFRQDFPRCRLPHDDDHAPHIQQAALGGLRRECGNSQDVFR